MVDSIKITSLQDIGSNIAYTTLVPVVDMSGTPTTKKSTLQNVGNLILGGAGGAYFPRAAQANLALSVANAAQPNITSVGTLTSLAVVGNISIQVGTFNGNASGLNSIPGANVVGPVAVATTSGTVTTAAQPNITSVGNLTSLVVTGSASFNGVSGGNIVSANYFVGDGGLLSNIVAQSNYSNSNVANYLPTYTGTVGATKVQSSSNVEIQTDGGLVWNFRNDGALVWPGGIGQIDTNVDVFEIRSINGLQISTDIADGNLHFDFGTDGVFTAPSNVNLLGTRLNIGHEAPNIFLQTPTIVIADSSNTFVQSALFNNDANGSADWVAYGAGGSDSEGWADMGFAGSTFSDENYTITAPGDGYIFVQGYANVGSGSLVLATGENGSNKDIVFSTGGFTQANAFARMEHSTNMLHLVRPGGGIQFGDGTIQSTAGIVWTTAPVSNTSPGTPGQAAYDAGGNLFICVAANTWSKFSGTTSW